MTKQWLLAGMVTACGAQVAPRGIQDNSFLVEEAYNQEPGVVQHIQTLSHADDAWSYQLTDEWPAGGSRNQVGFSIAALRPDRGNLDSGALALNYRLQVIGDSAARVAIASRATLSWPIDEYDWPTLTVNVPVSIEIAAPLVTHVNVGTIIDRAETSPVAYTFGESLIWIATTRFHLLVETSAEIAASQSMNWIVAPGFRTSFDFSSGLQIVCGTALVARVMGVGSDLGGLVYLSFEHPFRRRSGEPRS